MPKYRVKFRNGDVKVIQADSIEQARQIAKERNPYYPGKDYATSVKPASAGKVYPFGIGSPAYNRKHKVNPRTGMPRA